MIRLPGRFPAIERSCTQRTFQYGRGNWINGWCRRARCLIPKGTRPYRSPCHLSYIASPGGGFIGKATIESHAAQVPLPVHARRERLEYRSENVSRWPSNRAPFPRQSQHIAELISSTGRLRIMRTRSSVRLTESNSSRPHGLPRQHHDSIVVYRAICGIADSIDGEAATTVFALESRPQRSSLARLQLGLPRFRNVQCMPAKLSRQGIVQRESPLIPQPAPDYFSARSRSPWSQ